MILILNYRHQRGREGGQYVSNIPRERLNSNRSWSTAAAVVVRAGKTRMIISSQRGKEGGQLVPSLLGSRSWCYLTAAAVAVAIRVSRTMILSHQHQRGREGGQHVPNMPRERPNRNRFWSTAAAAVVRARKARMITFSQSVKGTALDRAEELEKKLPAEGPSFIKSMKHSQVVQGFWLGFPALFCRKYLPDHDLNIVLEDEEGEICNTNYLAYKTGLSGGWKGFTEQHDLEIGNVLVFHLVQPTRFKVYILRENKLSSTDGVLGHLSLDTSMENTTSKKDEEERSDQDIKSKEEELEVVTGDSSNASRDDSDNLASKEAAGGAIRSPSPDTVDFVAVKRLLDFKIEELKLRRTGVMKQLRYFESSVSILNDTLKEIDSEMEAMMEASTKKQKDQAVRKLAAAPW